MVKVLGRTDSANVQKVLWCLEELGVPYTQENYGGKYGNTGTAEYLALNPNGKVPTLVDGELVLWESNTIVRYLSARHGAGGLIPEEAGRRAACEKWMDWQLSVLSPALTPVRIGFMKTTPENRDWAAIEAGRAKLSAAIAIVDQHLVRTGNTYLEGDRLSIADLPVAMVVMRWFGFDIKREDYPAVRRWYDLIEARPAFVKAVKSAG